MNRKESSMVIIEPREFIISVALVSPWLLRNLLFESEPRQIYKEGINKRERNRGACGYFDPNNNVTEGFAAAISMLIIGINKTVEYLTDPR